VAKLKYTGVPISVGLIYGFVGLLFYPLLAHAACPPELLWSRTEEGMPSAGKGPGVAVDAKGNVIVAGSVEYPFNKDWLVRKWDSAGNLLWTRSRTAIDTYYDETYGVAVDSQDNIVVIGVITPVVNANHAWLIQKYAPSGTLLWERIFDTPSSPDWGVDVAVDSLDNVIAVGDESTLRWLIRKYDKHGTLQWSKTANEGDRAFEVAIDSSDNIIVSGTGDSGFLEPVDRLEKYTASGNLIWSRTVMGGTPGGIHDIAIDAGDNIVLAIAGPFGISKYNAAGDLLWSRTYSGDPQATWVGARGVAIDACGNVLAVGTREDSISGESTWVFVQYDSDGNLLCDWIFDNPQTDIDNLYSVAVDASGNIAAAGVVYDSIILKLQWLVRKYSPVTDCNPSPPPETPSPPPIDPSPPPPPPGEDLEAGTVKIVGGIRGYLDPKRGEQATILVRPTGAGNIRLRIYDQQGVLIREITQATGGGHTEVLHWDGKDTSGSFVAPGVYPIFIEGPGIRARDKLAVMR